MSWTTERTSRLEKLWMEGKSAAEIAKDLGGITRNAVIGKAHRMGLSGRPSPIKKGAATKTTKAKKSAKPKKATPKKAVAKTPASPTKKAVAKAKTPLRAKVKPIPAGPKKPIRVPKEGDKIGILDLTDRICKWPFNDPQGNDFYFCGDPVHPGRPYCAPHCTEAYQVLQKKAAAAKKAAEKAEEKAKAKAKSKKHSDEIDDEEEIELEDLDALDVDNIDNPDEDDDDDADLIPIS